MSLIEQEAIKLGQQLWRFQADKGLMHEFFQQPDSITYMPIDIAEFETRLVMAKEKLPFNQDGRFGALIKTTAKISIASLGSVEWVELVEPSELDVEMGWSGVQKINFLYPLNEIAKSDLERREVPYVLQNGILRDSISVIYHSDGHQFGLVNVSASDVVANGDMAR